MVLLLLTFCLLLLPLWEFVIVLCFVVRCFVSVLVLQSSWWGRESWLLCFCLPGVSWWLSGSSSRCHGIVCGLWLWYFLIILTYYFCENNSMALYKYYAQTKIPAWQEPRPEVSPNHISIFYKASSWICRCMGQLYPARGKRPRRKKSKWSCQHCYGSNQTCINSISGKKVSHREEKSTNSSPFIWWLILWHLNTSPHLYHQQLVMVI